MDPRDEFADALKNLLAMCLEYQMFGVPIVDRLEAVDRVNKWWPTIHTLLHENDDDSCF
jgi:hypothetical protein